MKPGTVCEMCEGQLATIRSDDMAFCKECYEALQETIENSGPCATCDQNYQCADCEFNAENQPDYSDGQPDEQQEWNDYDPDC